MKGKYEFWIIMAMCVMLVLAFMYWGYSYRDKAKTWNAAIDKCLRVCMCPSELNFTGELPMGESGWPFD